jgi:ribonuclease HI
MKHHKPTVTVFSDASVYHNHKVAGWAGYVRGDDRKPKWFQGPAVFSPDVTSVELEALAQSVQLAMDAGYITKNDTHILLQSDSLHGLEMIWRSLPNTWPAGKGDAKLGSKRPAKKDHTPHIQKLFRLLRNRQVVYLKHVRGHQQGIHSRSWVNEECDQRAKKEAKRQMK